MKKVAYISIWLRYCIFAVAAILFACCSSEDFPDIPGNTPADGDGVYLRLILSMPSATRANPTGGEYGDGEELGTDAENRIENLTLFIYDAADGPNATADTPILYSLYVGKEFVQDDDGTIEKIIKLSNFIPEAGHRLLVCANYGDLSYLDNLDKVRNHIAYRAWLQSDSPADARQFTMASAFDHDGVILFSDKDGQLTGTRERPLKTEVWLERTAAKIDIRYPEDSYSSGLGIKYMAGNDAVFLTDILPVNVMQTPSWLLKRVTTGLSDDYSCLDQLLYCGDETLDAGGCQTNYVVEPHTALKTDATTESTLLGWFGDTSIANITAKYLSLFAESDGIAGKIARATHRDDDPGFRRFTLTYTNENTQHATQHKAKFATGVLLKCTFSPDTVYKDASMTPDENYTIGTTFYRYTTDRTRDKKRTARYFSSLAETEKYRDLHPDEYGEIEAFTDGVCYYHASIRHSNAEDISATHLCHPMEYGIVRNNVYILSFLFTGIGRPTPEFDDPETLRIHVYVRPWNLRKQSTILM